MNTTLCFLLQSGRQKERLRTQEKSYWNRKSGEINHPYIRNLCLQSFLVEILLKSPRVLIEERFLQIGWHLLKILFLPEICKSCLNFISLDKASLNSVDDVRVSNPPSNPELLDQLSAKFTEYNYDFKNSVRDVCNSRTYQLSTKVNPSNESDTRNFARSKLRRLRAEIMLDVISQTTETKNKFQVFH